MSGDIERQNSEEQPSRAHSLQTRANKGISYGNHPHEATLSKCVDARIVIDPETVGLSPALIFTFSRDPEQGSVTY